MRKRWNICAVGFVLCALHGVWAQDNSNPPADNPPSTEQQPVPAYGQDNPNTVPPVLENPPLSGLDLPSLEPHAAPVSYLQPGVTVSESADSNAVNEIGGGTSFTSVSRGLASMTLKRLWSNYDLDLEYVGGAGYYTEQGQGTHSLQQADVNQKITWKRGQLDIRDSFSDLPEGNFVAAYGSMNTQGVGSINNTPFGALLGGSMLGSLGLTPRILNISLADVSEYLSPKSSVTALGGYAFSHFYGSDAVTGAPYIGASQISGMGGYNRILTPHTQVGVMYAYQSFDFSLSGLGFHSNVIQLMYGHRISGRMDFLVGAGPQFTRINLTTLFGTVPDNKISVAALARLRYRLPKTSIDLSYQRYETSGSGLFAGAQSDIGRLSVARPLSRVWNMFVDIGAAHDVRLQGLTVQQQASCVPPGTTPVNNPQNLPVCPGIDANSYLYGFVGGGLHRQFGHNFHGFLSYQFNEIAFDHSYCGGLPQCNRIANRQVITIGLDWIPRPIRID